MWQALQGTNSPDDGVQTIVYTGLVSGIASLLRTETFVEAAHIAGGLQTDGPWG